MGRGSWLWLGLLGLIALAGVSWEMARRPPRSPVTERLRLAETLGEGQTEGFVRATAPRDFVFPQDHGPHPQFKTEWWYYTGNLQTEQQRRFGYQLTFFRNALHPQAVARASAWGSNQVYMAHFALTDPDAQRFYHFERFSRAALGLAGATAEPFRVWLEDWSAVGGQKRSLPMRLSAAAGEVAIELRLDSAKPIVLQGEQGLSQKSAAPGNASYYYSMTRMPTVGDIRIGQKRFQVAGTSWLDREWSSSALGENQVGWDWFSLQLDDGRELMYYQLRRSDGSADPFSRGVLVRPDGRSRRLTAQELRIEVLDSWQSPHSKARYPARWRLRIPEEGLEVEVTPLLADQELQAAVRYWEGAVSLQGTSRGRALRGRGYVELTGYEK